MTLPKLLLLIFILSNPSLGISQNIYDTLRTVKMTAQANLQTQHLTIQWQDDPGENTYQLYKKMPNDTTWGNPLVTTGDQDGSYLDTEVENGKLYEYRLIKQGLKFLALCEAATISRSLKKLVER